MLYCQYIPTAKICCGYIPVPSWSPYTVFSVLLWLEAILSQLTPKNSLECPHNWPVGPPYSLGWQAGNECTGSDNIWKATAGLLRQVTGLSGTMNSVPAETEILSQLWIHQIPSSCLILQQEGKTNQYLIKTVNSTNSKTIYIYIYLSIKRNNADLSVKIMKSSKESTVIAILG